jgi:hypothetical protein
MEIKMKNHTDECLCGHDYQDHVFISQQCNLCDCLKFQCPVCVEEESQAPQKLIEFIKSRYDYVTTEVRLADENNRWQQAKIELGIIMDFINGDKNEKT